MTITPMIATDKERFSSKSAVLLGDSYKKNTSSQQRQWKNKGILHCSPKIHSSQECKTKQGINTFTDHKATLHAKSYSSAGIAEKN